MAEGGTGQSETGSELNEPVTDCDNTRCSDGTLVSFDSFEKSDMLPDHRGWLTESRTKKQFWCVAASNMLGLFDSPEGDELKKVLTLSDFHFEALIKDCDIQEDCDSEGCVSDTRRSSCPLMSKEFTLELTPVSGDRIFSFVVPTEKEFSLWSQVLHSSTEKTSMPHKQGMARQKKISFEENRRVDSGLGDDLDTCASRLLKREGSNSTGSTPRIPKQMSIESDGEFENRTELVLSRGSSFMSSLATNDDLTDSHSISDSMSGDNNSTVNLSEIEFADSEMRERRSLSDSVFLGGSQELDASIWAESKDSDCLVSDGDSAPTSPRPPTASSVSSTGDVTEGLRLDQSRTVISKVSKLVQRALIRRPRVTSGLTLGHLPEPRMSGPMRKKGKTRWFVLSDSCLYCFKNNSPEAEAEAIIDLSSYSVALATEQKEDGQSIGLLKLTHSSGKKVLFSINNMDTAQQWLDYLEEAIQQASSSRASRSDSQKSTSSNPDSQGHGSLLSRLSRESFEESYGYFERQSSLRAQRDAVHNAITELEKAEKQGSSSGSCASIEEKPKSYSFSDAVSSLVLESASPSSATTWQSSDDLDLTHKKTNPALRMVKRSVQLSPKSKRSMQQMPIPASDVVDPTLSGNLHVFLKNKGTWKTSWAVLKDDWLYFYKKPTDTTTSDIVELPNYSIQREHSVDDGTPLVSQKFMFSILHKDGSKRTIMMGETEKETRAWMEKLKGHSKKHSKTLDGLNLESGLSSHQLAPLDLSGKQHTSQNQAELHKKRLLLEVLQQNQLSKIEQGAPDNLEGSSEKDDPQLAKKKAEILAKYQKANDEEEEELVRYLTIQNRRRMSAQVKKDNLEKTIGYKTKRRVERLGSVEESAMEDQIRILNARLASIRADIEAKSTQKTNRLQALKEKKELELQLLEQQERLSRYRRLAQDALQGGVDFHSALAGLEEESSTDVGCAALGVDKSSRESPKEQSAVEADETDSSSMPERHLETVLALPRATAETSPPRSPKTRSRRLLPSLPYRKGEKPTTSTESKEYYQSDSNPVDEKRLRSQTAADSCQRTDAPSEKKSSPLARLRKISLGSKMAPDPTQIGKESKNRKISTGMKSSASFDEGLSVGKLLPTLKQSSSSTDLSVSASRESPSPRRVGGHEGKETSTPSPHRRRKISVPIKMPSMDNLFSSSPSKKERERKASTSNTPKLDNGAVSKTSASADRAPISSPSDSTDINGNVAQAQKTQEENSQTKQPALKDEIDPEVLRDIEEFEMMARKALLEAGWIIRA